jgi:hypothetical protein
MKFLVSTLLCFGINTLHSSNIPLPTDLFTQDELLLLQEEPEINSEDFQEAPQDLDVEELSPALIAEEQEVLETTVKNLLQNEPPIDESELPITNELVAIEEPIKAEEPTATPLVSVPQKITTTKLPYLTATLDAVYFTSLTSAMAFTVGYFAHIPTLTAPLNSVAWLFGIHSDATIAHLFALPILGIPVIKSIYDSGTRSYQKARKFFGY